MVYTVCMTDEITIDSEILISSKRASELSGYEQDYIGQLCRGGNIKARRVGGLWYVSADSLMKYKERAGEYKPEPPARNGEMHTPDSLVSFDGKGHVSTTRAAKISGYTPDYVGQLARAGTIPSRQVGNRWYVEQAGLLKHKTSKDALLAAVQVESVGLKPPVVSGAIAGNSYSYPENEQFFRYTSDNRDLTPSTGESADRLQVPMPTPSAFVARPADIRSIGPAVAPREEGLPLEAKDEEYVIPIHVHHERAEKARRVRQNTPVFVEPRHAMLPMLLPVGLFTVVIVLSVGFISLKRSSIYTSNSTGVDTNISQSASAGIAAVGRFVDILETWIAPELVYRRKE